MTMDRSFLSTNASVYGVIMVAMMFSGLVAGLSASLARQSPRWRRKIALVWTFVSGYAVGLGVRSLSGCFSHTGYSRRTN